MTDAERLRCCHIDPAGAACTARAEFVITTAGTGDPYDYTEACEAHVGALLGSTTDTPADYWTVHELTTAPREDQRR